MRTTQKAISSKFIWPSMMQKISEFTKVGLHCVGSKDSKVPRTLGGAMHTSERNPVLHYYVLFINKSKDTMFRQYLLVIKDDFSHCVELCSPISTDHLILIVVEYVMNF